MFPPYHKSYPTVKHCAPGLQQSQWTWTAMGVWAEAILQLAILTLLLKDEEGKSPRAWRNSVNRLGCPSCGGPQWHQQWDDHCKKKKVWWIRKVTLKRLTLQRPGSATQMHLDASFRSAPLPNKPRNAGLPALHMAGLEAYFPLQSIRIQKERW
jgi:hypothetical protein